MPPFSHEVQFHHDSLVIDSHNDSVVSHIRRGNLSLDGSKRTAVAPPGTIAWLRDPLPSTDSGPQLDFKKMQLGGLDAGIFYVDVSRAWKNHLAYGLDGIGFLKAEIGACPQTRLAKSADDVVQAKRDGGLAVLIGMENSDACEGSLNVLDALYELGVRSICLTHNLRSYAADGNAETVSRGGLTRFGGEMVARMNQLGMVVDVSHLSPRGLEDVLRICTKPIMASHSCCRSLRDHPRNLSDEQIRAIADSGGVIGVTFVAEFLGEPPVADRSLIDHIDHVVQLVGPDHVGIGSDFDGGGSVVPDATAFPRITLALFKRGYTEDDIESILGGNHLRVLRTNIG